jgi:hypothetical protein
MIYLKKKLFFINYDTPDIAESGDYMMNDKAPAEKKKEMQRFTVNRMKN